MAEQLRRNILVAEWDLDGCLKVNFVDPPADETQEQADEREVAYQERRRSARRETDPNGARARLRSRLGSAGMDVHIWGD